ncbi:MAG: peptidylprolyl isomerase [Bdellovibrionales bacterium]|nr:peptidylprolyl isomerase [Bdellovibrionales bacterium]
MRSKFSTRLAACIVTSLCFSLPALAETAKPDPKGAVLAKINGTTISLEDFNARYKENLKFFQFKAPAKQAVLDDLIKRELAIQEAKKLGLEKDPVVIERINTVLYQAVLDKQLGKDLEKITVSDDEAQAFYRKNPEVRTSHIFVALRPDAPADQESAAKKRMASIQESLKQGASFAEVAQNKSDGPAAAMGGDIDYKTKDSLDPAYYQAALALGKPGKVSGVVRTPFGLHLIKLTAVRSWEDADQAMVKRQIFDEKRTVLFEKYMDKLRRDAKVQINASLLKD